MNNEEMIAYWNGEAGKKWAERDSQMARILAPVAEDLLDHAEVGDVQSALDVGCGGGSNTFLLAERLASNASIVGVDVSAPMLAIAEAQRRAKALDNIRFLEADAAAHDFGEERFDLLFSRFGVMFFDEPTAAFANMRKAMNANGRLAFACWQPLKANAWTALPFKAALTVLPPPPPPPPRAPGPFAFGDDSYLRQVLTDAGWQDIAIASHSVTMSWPATQDYPTTVRELVTTGPVSRLVEEANEEQREAIYAATADALESFFDGERLSLPGAVWLVTANSGT